MRVLVTGGSGLIGRRVCESLRSDHDVVSWGRTDPEIEGVVHCRVDLSVDERLDLHGFDAVVHLAQSAAYRELPRSVADVEQVNVRSTALLAEAARIAGLDVFVNASSGSVYRPRFESGPLELADLNDMSLYGATKRSGELLLSGFRDHFRVVSLRYFMVYGAAQDRRMLIPSLIDRVANDRPLTLQGNDGLVFPPTHVDDAAAVTIRALKAPSGAFDVCGPSAISMRDLGAIIGNALGRSVRFEIHDGPSPYLVGHQPVDFLGSSSITPEDGVAALCRGDW